MTDARVRSSGLSTHPPNLRVRTRMRTPVPVTMGTPTSAASLHHHRLSAGAWRWCSAASAARAPARPCASRPTVDLLDQVPAAAADAELGTELARHLPARQLPSAGQGRHRSAAPGRRPPQHSPVHVPDHWCGSGLQPMCASSLQLLSAAEQADSCKPSVASQCGVWPPQPELAALCGALTAWPAHAGHVPAPSHRTAADGPLPMLLARGCDGVRPVQRAPTWATQMRRSACTWRPGAAAPRPSAACTCTTPWSRPAAWPCASAPSTSASASWCSASAPSPCTRTSWRLASGPQPTRTTCSWPAPRTPSTCGVPGRSSRSTW